MDVFYVCCCLILWVVFVSWVTNRTKFKVGDIIEDETRESWQKAGVFEVLQVGKYKYQLRDIETERILEQSISYTDDEFIKRVK